MPVEAPPIPTTAAAAPGGPEAPASKPGMAVNPLYSLKRHKLLAVLLLAAIAGIGLPVAWWKGTPVYGAEAVVYISPRFLRNLQEDKEFEFQSNSQYREYVQQNVRTINRYDIVAAALARLGPKQARWQMAGETDRHAAERLQGALDIRPIPDTYQVVVGLESRRPEGLAELINAVIDTYIERAKAEEFYASDQRLKDLRQDQQRLQQEIDAKQQRRTELAQELGVSTFTENFPNPYDRLLVGGKEALADATRKRIEADASLASVDGEGQSQPGKALAAYAREQAAKDAALTSIQSNLNQRRAELLMKMSGLSREHPGQRAAESEIAGIDRELARVFAGLEASYAGILLEQRRGEAVKYARAEAGLRGEVERQAAQAAWFTEKYQEAMTLKLDIERARKRLDAIEDRVNFLALETQAPGFVRMFSRARPPDTPARGGRKKLALAFLCVALVVAVAAPTALDVLDSRIYSARDLHRTLGFEPLGWFVEEGLAPEFLEEQALRLANRLDQDRTRSGSRIFAFTGALPGAGTTTVVERTARALTRLGVPALAVEANAYRPDRRYGSRGGGLAVVLRGNRDLQDAIEAGDGDVPDHVGTGDIEGARHLPDMHRLIEILRAGAENYQIVLVDLAPLVLSVDAEYVARAADVVVMVVEAGATNRAAAKRSAVALERLQPKAVAAMVNRVRLDGLDAAPRRAVEEYRKGRS